MLNTTVIKRNYINNNRQTHRHTLTNTYIDKHTHKNKCRQGQTNKLTCTEKYLKNTEKAEYSDEYILLMSIIYSSELGCANNTVMNFKNMKRNI